jgi:hypothetical protein
MIIKRFELKEQSIIIRFYSFDSLRKFEKETGLQGVSIG